MFSTKVSPVTFTVRYVLVAKVILLKSPSPRLNAIEGQCGPYVGDVLTRAFMYNAFCDVNIRTKMFDRFDRRTDLTE